MDLCNSQTTIRAAASTDSSNISIAQMIRQSTQEARTMKLLTFVALVFVPASFVAVSYPVQE